MADSSSIWCLVSSSSHNELQVKEIAGYALALLRPGRDAAVLAADSSTRDFADFCKEILGIQESQLIWVPNPTCYITARDLDADTAKHIKDFMQLYAAPGTSDQQQQQQHDLDSSCQQQQQQLAQQWVPPGAAPTLQRPFQLIPYGVTPALQQWMAQHQLGLPLLCDDVGLGHKGMMHRHVRQLDKPSKIEALNPSITVPQGYACSSVEDLLVAFRLIGRNEAVVKPLYGKEGKGVLFVSSAEELRLYDFPLGDVVLEEALVVDKGEDGISISASHLTMGQQVVGAYEKVCVGTVKFGMRSTEVPSDFESTTTAWTSQILGMLSPAGPGYLSYASVAGRPLLMGLRLGQLSTEHFAALFMQQHAPGASFYCWTTALPHRGLDIWTFWARIQEQGVAFNPSAAAHGAAGEAAGVFPLLFLKGSLATLLAIGKDKEQVAQLRAAADACLREPLSDAPQLELVSWRDDVRRIWASGPRPEYRRQTQRYNLSNRCIPLVRKGLDVIILPGGHEGTREFAAFCKDVLQLGEEQVIFTSGSHYNLDDDVDESVVSKVKALLVSNAGDKFTLVPYAVTENFQRWASQLSEFGVSVFGESLEWIQQYGHKGILHRSMAAPDQPSVIEQINPKIPVARGYYCETSQQLLEAYKALGMKDVVLKPVYGAAGEGILFVHDEQELALYDFPMGGVCLEEFLQLDRAADGIILSPAVHYMEGQLVGQGLVDQIMVGTSYSGWRPSVVNKAFSHTAIKMTNDILHAIKPRGPGGFDWLSVGGKPVLTDVNTGRFNGAHSPKLFVELYAPQQKFYVWKQKPPERITVWQFWQRLQDAGVAFWPGKDRTGVFPMIFLPGLSGQFVAIAGTDEQAQALRPLAEDCLKVPARTRPPAIPQKYSLFKRADIVRKANWRRIWCLSPLNSKFVTTFNVNQLTPLHAVALLRPGVDAVLLPSRPDVREFYGFVKAIVGLQEGQVIWTSGKTNCLHTDIDSEVLERIRELIKSNDQSAPEQPAAAAAAAAVCAQSLTSTVSASASIEQQERPALTDTARLQQQQQDGVSAAAVGGSSGGSSRSSLDGDAFALGMGSVTASRSTSWLTPSVHVGMPGGNSSNGSSTQVNSVVGSHGHTTTGTMMKAATAAAAASNNSKSSSSSMTGWTIIPDTPSTSFQKWAGPLVEEGVRVFADLPSWMSQYGHKGIMHEHISKVSPPAPDNQAAAFTSSSSHSNSAAAHVAATVSGAAEEVASAAAATNGVMAAGSVTSAGSAVAKTAFGAAAAAAATTESGAVASMRVDGMLDDLKDLVYVPRGYICSTIGDLHQAFDVLGCSSVTIKPIRGGVSPGEGVLRCSSKQELSYYDFPLGDVVLEEDLELDYAPDGFLLLPRLPYLACDRLGDTVVDLLLVGDQVGGYRPSCLPAEVQNHLAEVSARFLSQVSPKGAGALSFGLSRGKLVLLGAQMGTFVPEHFIKMFMERWAEDCTYFCWQHVPPKGLDVWQFWSRLVEAGVAFKPGASNSGVYPLIYLPGVMGTFIAISPDEPELATLKEAAYQALTAPLAAAAAAASSLLLPAGWQQSDRHVFVTGPGREHRQQALQHVLPVRSLALVRKSRDVVVVPGGHDPTDEFVGWASKQLGLQPNQVLRTPGHRHSLDEDIESGDCEVLPQLKELVVTSQQPWAFVPLKPSPAFETWAGPFHELGVRVVGEIQGSRFSSKAILHRRVSAPEAPSVIEKIDPDIQVPHGYICASTAELLAAYNLLLGSNSSSSHQHSNTGSSSSGSRPVLLKPLLSGSDGEGLLVVSDEEQLVLYDFIEGQEVVLQELLTLDRAPDGMVLSLAVPFAAGSLLHGCVMDEIIVGQSSLGFRPSEAPRRFKQKAMTIAQTLLHEMEEVVMGTFYFVSVKGEPVLMSYDSSNCSGIHLPRLFVEQHAPPGSCFYTWRFKPPPGVGVQRFWDHLKAKGLAFEPGKPKGVFPLYYLRGLEAQLVAIGGSALDCCLLQDKARRTVDHAFRRRISKTPGPRGTSPQPAPPLDGGNTLQLPLLGLGPPATALGMPGGVAAAGNGAVASWNSSSGMAAQQLGPTGLSGLSPTAASSNAAQFPAMGALSGPFGPGSQAAAGFQGSSGVRGFGLSSSSGSSRRQLDLTLLMGAEAIYGPLLLEERNVLLAGGKIVGILDDAAAGAIRTSVEGLSVLDCTGCIITPGFVDCHVHITGGGGEAGPASRCPPARLSEFLDSGVTCVVGLLGTDDISRSNEELIIKARALNEEGMTAYTWIGSYHAPPATVTGSIRRDMCLVESALGVGELAIADHRGSQMTATELAKIAAEARVGGMLSGKVGLVHIHVGPGPSGLQLLRDAIAGSDIPITQFHPTHMDRSEELIEQGAQWLLDGGSLDFTVRSIRARRALQQYHQSGVPLHNATVSSDAFGSLPSYDSGGRLIKYTVADARALLRFLRNMYFQDHWPLERILPLLTSNPARLLKLKHKGSIAVGCDADLLVLSHDTLQLRWVYAKGVMKKSPQWTQGGFFEKGAKIRPYHSLEDEDDGKDF